MDQNNSCTVGDYSNISRNGLVCQYQFEDGSSQFIFLQVGNGSKDIRIDGSLSFCTENYVQLISSSNGFLLFFSIGEREVKFHVLDPISKQFFTLPPPVITRQIIQSGLASDRNNYQVVLVHAADKEENDEGIEFEIFCSETGKWRRFCPPNLFLSSPVLEFEFSELKTLPLYCNGAIHWEISGHLLVYRVSDDYSELIELPNFLEDWSWQFTTTYKRCLFELRGRVHYSYTDFEGVQTWVLLTEHDHEFYSCYNVYDRKKFRWALAYSFNHQGLNLKTDEVYLQPFRSDWKPYNVSPIGFCEDSETVYLKLPGFLVSFNTKTKVLEEICTYTFHGENFNCCSFLPFMYDRPFHPETETDSSEAGLPDLPMKEKLGYLSF